MQTILAGQAEGKLDAASQLADRIAEVAPLPVTASIAQNPESASLLQKIDELSRQVAALSSGRTRHRSHSKNRREENGDSPPPQNTARRIAVVAGPTGDPGRECGGAQHHAPTTGRETAATGVDSGRRLFHIHCPPVHHRQS